MAKQKASSAAINRLGRIDDAIIKIAAELSRMRQLLTDLVAQRKEALPAALFEQNMMDALSEFPDDNTKPHTITKPTQEIEPEADDKDFDWASLIPAFKDLQEE